MTQDGAEKKTVLRGASRWVAVGLFIPLITAVIVALSLRSDLVSHLSGAVPLPAAEALTGKLQRARDPSSRLNAPAQATPKPVAALQGTIVLAGDGVPALTLVDAATQQVTRTVQVGAPVRTLSVAPDQRTVWVFSARPDASDVQLLDVGTGRLARQRVRAQPRTASFSADGSQTFVTLERPSSVRFMDARQGRAAGEVPLGQQSRGLQLRRQPDAIVTLHRPEGDLVYVAGRGSGLVWVLDASSRTLLAEIPVGGGPVALLAAPDGQRVYAVLDTLNQLVTIDPSTQTVSRRLPLPGPPAAAAIAPTNEVYVAGQATEAGGGVVWIIDPLQNAVRRQVSVGAQPSGIAISGDGGAAYVASRGDGTVTVIDVASQAAISQFPVAQPPTAIAFVPPSTSADSAAEPQPAAGDVSGVAAAPSPTSASDRPADNLPAGTLKEVFVPSADFPAAMAFAPDGRLFYTERLSGQIRIVQDGQLLPDPFYTFSVASEPETGLLGLALDPGFEQNHYVYIYYTAQSSGGSLGQNQLVRLTEVDGRGTDLTPILTDLPSGPIHNGGRLRFGPDGKLYVSVGETDHMEHAQDLGSLGGKILRINPDGSIPPDNPFVGQTGLQPAVWAYGLRNVFSLDFHPVNGAMIAADNGPGDNDEFDLIVRGGNYGWPPAGFLDKPPLIDPIGTLNPVISPTGLAFYPGEQIPDWTNDLFYCNYHQGQLRRIRLAAESYDRIASEEIVTPGCTLDVQPGPDGALYYSDVHTISRIRRADAQALPAVAGGATPDATPTAAPPGARAEDRDINVDLTEWKIALSRDTTPAGHLRLVIANLGSTAHALRIEGQGVDVATEEIKARQTEVLEVDLSPGRYRLTCPISGHTEQGMVTSLTVQ